MNKKIIIQRCSQCIHRARKWNKIDQNYTTPICAAMQDKWIMDEENIPDWCPLDDDT